LGVIRNAAFLLNRKLGEHTDQECLEYIKIIEREVDGANRIIANLSETTRAKSPNRQNTNLDSLIEEIMRGVNVPSKISFHYRRNPRPFMINADRMQLKQVLNNLINNAISAIGDKGFVFLFASSANDIDVLRLIDTGPGIPENVRESIFEPLFTTKSKGTGLGLWISKEIVYRHRGALKVINHSDLSPKELQVISEIVNDTEEHLDMPLNPDLGACFEITIPH
jgi:signal transduction histidine kinase